MQAQSSIPNARRAAIVAMLLVVATAANAQTANAQTAVSQEHDGWQFSVTPYLWMAGQSGTVRVGQVVPAQNVNVGFSNVLSNLDFGVMGTLEVRKDRWLMIVDGFYIKLSRSSDPILGGDLGTARLSVDNGIVQFAGGYRVLQSETTPVDVLAGIRYTNLNTDLSFSPSPLLPAGAQHGDRVDWVDGLLGVRATYKFADRWTIWGYADAGAGGSNFSWQLIAALLWDATKSVSLSGGFRVLAQDYNTTSFYYNVKTAGPFLGVRVRF